MQKEKQDNGNDKGKKPTQPKGQEKDKEVGSKPPANTNKHKLTKRLTVAFIGWTKQDRIAAISAVLSFVAVVIAIRAVNQTNKSLELTKNSLELADSSFRIQLRSYLQPDGFIIDTFEIGKNVSMKYRISNFGQYPIKLLTADIAMATSDREIINPFKEVPTLPTNHNILNKYIPNEGSSGSITFNSQQPLTKEQFDTFFNPKGYLFFTGKINYVNEATRKEEVYFFNVRLLPPKGSSIILYSENNPE